jgi:DNA-binding CsgD family transcriptional regulator
MNAPPSEAERTRFGSTSPLERGVGWLRQRTAWLLGGISLFFIYDIALDVHMGEWDAHVLVEAVIFVVCVVVLFLELRRNLHLTGRLRTAHARNQRLSGQFADYVRTRFAGWSLSRSEQEIAWLLLKGFSFTEIAALREVQEKTVRQQATSIYAKSGSGGRSEFVAHFIEDLLTGEHVAGQSEATSAPGRTPE